MKYLSREWYELCQKTDLYFDMRVHPGADTKDDALFRRLYRKKEKAYLILEEEIYNTDPRLFLDQEGESFVPLDQLLADEEITEDDILIVHLSEEEKAETERQIEAFDARPPFSDMPFRKKFKQQFEQAMFDVENQLPSDLKRQIADFRVFALGYCTRYVKDELKRISRANERVVNRILRAYETARLAESIPEDLGENFSAHDCRVLEVVQGKDLVIRLDTQSGFTGFDRFCFTNAKILKSDGDIIGRYWLYNELYQTADGYEAHILFSGDPCVELTLSCRDILIDNQPATKSTDSLNRQEQLSKT